MTSELHTPFEPSDPDDISVNDSGNRPFGEVLTARLSRRSVLRTGGVLAAAGFLSGVGASTGASRALASSRGAGADGVRRLLGFTAVPTSDADVLTVPDGYVAEVLIPWGTPIMSTGPAWMRDGSNSAADQAQQVGSHHDGMHFFPLGRGPERDRRGLLVLNHEFVERRILYPDGDEVLTQEKVDKALAAHGVTIIEVELSDGRWRTVDSSKNRRITGATPMAISGPVSASHPEMQALGPVLGTLNNCSHGVTPWGTYLACEENFDAYFGTEDSDWEPTAEQARFGVNRIGWNYRWWTVDPRFDIATNPNEVHRFGWCVEIDPFDPSSTPVKRTALGRFKHEGATITESRGRLVVYSGDDQNGEYVYKFVSEAPWRQMRARGRSPLDHGTLYVARFDDDGTGKWLPLEHGHGPLVEANGWTDQADVLLRTRRAADALGATPLDRAEWVAVNPRNQDVYLSLTNGSGGDNAVTPRIPNPYGHIISWRERRGDNTATEFEWDIFVLAGDPEYDDAVALDDDAIFGSPDGLWFDPDGRLWIQTDISGSVAHLAERGYDRLGNNAMLAADPDTGDIRRFLVGPRGCEVTGVITTPDQRTMFVNIQHPGEPTTAFGTPSFTDPQAVSSWPDHEPDGRPRSATIAIRKIGGGVVGT